MRRFLRSLVPLGAALATACGEAPVTGPDFHAARAPLHTVSVLNWNIYVGTNVDAVLVALASPDPADDVPAMLAAIERFQATDFATRAEAIADRIAHKRPHVVGLQEVSEISVDLTALGVPIVIDLDFLAVLQAALAARGLRYEVAAAVTNTVATPLPGIRLVDHDVLLADPARADVVSTIARNFAVSLGVVAPGVEIKRGWVAATASVDGRTYTFVNTHLEAGAGEPFSRIRAAQALELMAALDGAAPVVLMGDLNDEVGSPMYAVVAGAGFVDLWAALRPGAPGLTCCHDSDLSNPVATFDQRIDYVLTRGFDAGKPHPRGQITIVGEVPADRLAGPAYPIWPSDHAGLAATLLAPPQGVIMAAAATARREP